MHSVMAGYVERGEIPGLVTLISRRGAVHVDPVGTLALDGAAPVRPDSIFRIASMSKPVVAVAAMILVEECRLRLDEPVDGLLPELAERRVLRRMDGPLGDVEPARRPVSLRDLLTFTMGFGIIMAPPGTHPIQRALDELELGQGQPNPARTPAPDEWMKRLATLPLMHQPGQQWMYNTGSDVLGVLIARVSGQPLETFLRERVFEPLGMIDTGFSVPAGKTDRFVTGYEVRSPGDQLVIFDEADGGQWSRPPAFPSGAGGLVSTVDDYLAFARMLLDGGRYRGGRILSRPSVEVMTSDQLTPEQKAAGGLSASFFASHGWGFGMTVVTRRSDPFGPVGTYGWDGGLGTSWRSDPREDMITILLTQRAWTSPIPPAVVVDFRTSAYQAIED
jgi:CubicO group peptidase (beta-lactamase class C family)